MKKCIAIILLLLFIKPGFAQQSAPSSQELLNAAYKKAAAENKNILLIFHASWCGWCHKMDSSLNDPACKKFFDDHYIITHLTVLESVKMKGQENKGAEELLKKYKAFDTGIPFWVILDKEGHLLRDSFLKKANGKAAIIGCPASEKEVSAFIEILKATSAITDQELAIIAAIFRLNEKK